MSCIICGEDLKDRYSLKLDCNCNYEFHYECIASTLKYDKYNKCPYCSKPEQFLPLVNGLKKIDSKIHKIDNNIEYNNIKCNAILKSGKNKGSECGNYCKLGYYQCTRHLK